MNSWSFFRAAEIHDLDQHDGFEGESFYFYKNLPIKWVRVVGIVVAIDEFSGRRVYTVDDSSGACIECTVAMPTAPQDSNEVSSKAREKGAQSSELFPDIGVCSIVDVKGGLSTFRDEKQINIAKMHALRTTAEEVALWERRSQFRKAVLDKPWVLRDEDIRKCRKQAERSGEEIKRKRQKLKARIEAQSATAQLAALTEEPSADSGREKKRKKTSREELRRVIADRAKEKYEALGL